MANKNKCLYNKGYLNPLPTCRNEQKYKFADTAHFPEKELTQSTRDIVSPGKKVKHSDKK